MGRDLRQGLALFALQGKYFVTGGAYSQLRHYPSPPFVFSIVFVTDLQ